MKIRLAEYLRRLVLRLDPEPEVKAASTLARQRRHIRDLKARVRELQMEPRTMKARLN